MMSDKDIQTFALRDEICLYLEDSLKSRCRVSVICLRSSIFREIAGKIASLESSLEAVEN